MVKAGDGFPGVVQIVEYLSGMREQGVAGVGQPQTPAAAFDEGAAGLVLQGRDAFADSGLGRCRASAASEKELVSMTVMKAMRDCVSIKSVSSRQVFTAGAAPATPISGAFAPAQLA